MEKANHKELSPKMRELAGLVAEAVAAALADQAKPLLVTDVQAADLVNVSRSHWRTMDAGEHVPARVKLQGRNALWSRAEIEAWVRAGCPGRKTWEFIKASPAARPKFAIAN